MTPLLKQQALPHACTGQSPGAVEGEHSQEPQRARQRHLQLSQQLKCAGAREAVGHLPSIAATAPPQAAQRRSAWRRQLLPCPGLGRLPASWPPAALLREARGWQLRLLDGSRCRRSTACRHSTAAAAATKRDIEQLTGLALGGQQAGGALQLLAQGLQSGRGQQSGAAGSIVVLVALRSNPTCCTHSLMQQPQATLASTNFAPLPTALHAHQRCPAGSCAPPPTRRQYAKLAVL